MWLAPRENRDDLAVEFVHLPRDRDPRRPLSQLQRRGVAGPPADPVTLPVPGPIALVDDRRAQRDVGKTWAFDRMPSLPVPVAPAPRPQPFGRLHLEDTGIDDGVDGAGAFPIDGFLGHEIWPDDQTRPVLLQHYCHANAQSIGASQPLLAGPPMVLCRPTLSQIRAAAHTPAAGRHLSDDRGRVTTDSRGITSQGVMPSSIRAIHQRPAHYRRYLAPCLHRPASFTRTGHPDRAGA